MSEPSCKTTRSELNNSQSEEAPSSKRPKMLNNLVGLRPISRSLSFTLDLNCFNDLVRTTYSQLCAREITYGQNVSLGMFSYYCGLALWYRLFAIRHAQGNDFSWAFLKLKANFPNGFLLPMPIVVFLNQIGDFRDPYNLSWKFVFPAPNNEGHFGRMSADTFYKYMAFPAPAILIQNLRQELKVCTEDVKPYSKWRLEAIDPEQGLPPKRMFSSNVCGYQKPCSVYRLTSTSTVYKLLSKVFAAPENIKNFAGVIVAIDICNQVHEYHQSNGSLYPMDNGVNETRSGSLIQMGFVESCSLPTELPGKDVDYFRGDLIGYSPCQLLCQSDTMIPIYRLRAKRKHRVGAYPYDFSSVEDVPQDWPANLNTYFQFGDVATRLNSANFSTGIVGSQTVLAEFIASFIE